jgi:hypothetical protein
MDHDEHEEKDFTNEEEGPVNEPLEAEDDSDEEEDPLENGFHVVDDFEPPTDF